MAEGVVQAKEMGMNKSKYDLGSFDSMFPFTNSWHPVGLWLLWLCYPYQPLTMQLCLLLLGENLASIIPDHSLCSSWNTRRNLSHFPLQYPFEYWKALSQLSSIFLTLKPKPISLLINPMRSCFLKPWSLLVRVSGCFLISAYLLWRMVLINRYYLSWDLAGDPRLDSQSSFSISHQ